MRAFRSLLFVPGHKPAWIEKAVATGVDAVVMDLEDSVPHDAKQKAREAVAASIDHLAAHRPHTGVVVRPNALETDDFGADLEAVVRPGLEALLVPKIYSANDIYRFDGLLTHLELRAGMQRGSIELIPSLETAASVALADTLAACPRVSSLQSATARDGDIAREVGFVWSAGGIETLYLRSKAVLASRSNGLSHPLCGVWQDIADIEGLRAFAEQNRALGFRGQLVLHPSHVGEVNRVFSVTPDEVSRARRMVECYESALRAGSASVMFEGEHVDTAHIKTSRALIELAQKQELNA